MASGEPPAAGAEGDAPGLADAPQEVSKQQLEGSDDLHVGAFEGMNDAALALSPQHIEVLYSTPTRQN